MNAKYRLYQRANGVFFVHDNETNRQESLKTKDRTAAQRLWMAKNEAHEQPAINLQLARAYLSGSDHAYRRRRHPKASGSHLTGE